ncbi:MAG: hypothetical protein K0S48_2623 [Ramlibacter sp.]|jgi:hypothetical protein|nr:hypothetical protein [Ramlibacter sp.]MCE3273639.1 hypothetical protein [Ramlibacter sp.]
MSLRTKKALLYTGAAALLVAVFVLYTRPQMMVTLGDMIWACFQ